MIGPGLLSRPDRLEYSPEEAVAVAERIRAENNYLKASVINAQEYAAVGRLLFHWTLYHGLLWMPEQYEDRWCYASAESALQGLAEWEQRQWADEPTGWHRHPMSGRRRPDGIAASEYVYH